MNTPLTFDTLLLKKAALQYRALNHQLRQKILYIIHQQGSITVTPLYKALKLEQSVTSQHLAILRRAGMVTTRREGKQIFYSVNYQRLTLIQKMTEELLGKNKQLNH